MKKTKEGTNNDEGPSMKNDDDDVVFCTCAKLKKARKKVEYYASWCIHYWEDVRDEIIEDLTNWSNDWSLKGLKKDSLTLSEEENMFVVLDEKDVASTTGIHGFLDCGIRRSSNRGE